jgi:hypothetical protein
MSDTSDAGCSLGKAVNEELEQLVDKKEWRLRRHSWACEGWQAHFHSKWKPAYRYLLHAGLILDILNESLRTKVSGEVLCADGLSVCTCRKCLIR